MTVRARIDFCGVEAARWRQPGDWCVRHRDTTPDRAIAGRQQTQRVEVKEDA